MACFLTRHFRKGQNLLQCGNFSLGVAISLIQCQGGAIGFDCFLRLPQKLQRMTNLQMQVTVIWRMGQRLIISDQASRYVTCFLEAMTALYPNRPVIRLNFEICGISGSRFGPALIITQPIPFRLVGSGNFGAGTRVGHTGPSVPPEGV